MHAPMRELTISSRADPAYIAAFRTLAMRVARSANATALAPITMFLAGGAAMHFYTGARMTDDIDAVFDRRILVPEDSTVIYRDTQGRARSVYFDMNYNESYALPGYVGNLVPLRTSIMLACRDIDALSGDTRP